MKHYLILFLAIISIPVFSQVNIHSHNSVYQFNPSLASLDSYTRIYVSYSNVDSYWNYSYGEVAFNSFIPNTRYSLSGYVKFHDYLSELEVIKPISSMVAISPSFWLRLKEKPYIFKPFIEIGFTTLSMIGTKIFPTNGELYVVNAQDSRFRYSSGFILYNNRFNLGVNFNGINRPKYKTSKPTLFFPEPTEFGVSFSNLFAYFMIKKQINHERYLSIFLKSSDKIPYAADMTDHYWAAREIGLTSTWSKLSASISIGVLNNNLLFKQYRADLKYRLWKFDIGLSYNYCDDPKTYSNTIWQSDGRSFPMTDATYFKSYIQYNISRMQPLSSWSNMIEF